jgi:hypothetical protein
MLLIREGYRVKLVLKTRRQGRTDHARGASWRHGDSRFRLRVSQSSGLFELTTNWACKSSLTPGCRRADASLQHDYMSWVLPYPEMPGPSGQRVEIGLMGCQPGFRNHTRRISKSQQIYYKSEATGTVNWDTKLNPYATHTPNYLITYH